MKSRLRLCILSNSHAGALKQGWDKISDLYRDKLEITFFAQRHHGMKSLAVSDEALVPKTEKLRAALEFTSGGRSYIDPADYDIFLVFGLGFRAVTVNVENYTQSFLQESVEGYIKESPLYDVYSKLVCVTGKSIYLSHNPLKSYSKPFNERPISRYYDGLRLCNKVSILRGQDKFLGQPEATIEGGWKTKPYFCNNSSKANVGDVHDGQPHGLDDLSHMNEKFGVAWLESFIALNL